MQTIRGVVKNTDFVGMHVLKSYLDKITSVEGELQGLKERIVSLSMSEIACRWHPGAYAGGFLGFPETTPET